MKTRTRALTAVAAVLIAAPTLAACGGGSDSDDAAATLQSYFHALGDKDADAACKLQTTEDGKKPLESDDAQLKACVKGLKALTSSAKNDELKQMKDVSVKEATVDGDKATVSQDQVENLPADSADSGDKSKVHLVKIDDTWYMDASNLGG